MPGNVGAGQVVNDYFNTFVPANPYPLRQPIHGADQLGWSFHWRHHVGADGFVGDNFGDKLYGWFIPPVTTNYVFFTSCDDGCQTVLEHQFVPQQPVSDRV